MGDGLASQLPALLTTTAAGVLISRVAAEQDHLGDDLIEQLGAHPKALGVAAAVLGVLGALPGLPLAPMWALAFAFGGLAWAAWRSRAKAQGEVASVARDGSALGLPEALWVSCHAQDAGRLEGLPARWEQTRRRFAQEDGVEVPALKVVVGRFGEEPGRASVALWELPASQTAWERPEEVVESVEQAVRRDLASFVGAQAVQRKLDAIKAEAPEEVSAAVPKPVSLARLTSVVQRMVEERVPVRDLRPTLAAFAREAREDMRLDALVELGRQSQRRAISWRFGGPGKVVRAWTLDPEVEDMIRASIKDDALSLPAGIRRDLLKLAQPLAADAGALVVTKPELRRHVRDILRVVQREVTVLSYAELLPELRLEPAGVLRPR
jgi:flagellar biosynthesis component FlhA